MHIGSAMQMRLILVVTLLLLLTGCCCRELPGRSVAVFADDLCSVGGPRLQYETFYSDDSVTGKISSSGKFSADFYLGRHPDYRKLSGEQRINSKNKNITSLRYLTSSDGFSVAEVKLKGIPERSVLLFRGEKDLMQNASFGSFLDSLRRCRIR
jgi:hypothetical protein